MAYENVKILSKHVGLCRICTARIALRQLLWTLISTLCGARNASLLLISGAQLIQDVQDSQLHEQMGRIGRQAAAYAPRGCLVVAAVAGVHPPVLPLGTCGGQGSGAAVQAHGRVYAR